MCVSAEMLVTPGEAKIERRDSVAERLAEWKQEASEAAIDVQADPPVKRERR